MKWFRENRNYFFLLTKYYNCSDLEVFLDIAILLNPGNSTEHSPSLEVKAIAMNLIAYTLRCHQLLRFHRHRRVLLNLPRRLRLNHRRQRFPIENKWGKRIGTSLNGKSKNISTFWNFLRYYRPFSETGLDNYIANAEYFSKGSATFGETQFADLDVVQLRKVFSVLSWVIINWF